MDVATAAAAAAAAAAPPADDAGMIDGCPGIPPLDMDSHSTHDDSTEFNNTATTPAAQTPRSCVIETQVTSRVDVNSHEIHAIDETSHENVTSPAPSNQSRDSFTAQPGPESAPLVEIKPQQEEPNTEDCEVKKSAVCEMETSILPPPASSSSSSLVMESDLPPVSRQSPKPIVVEPKPEVSDSPTMHLSGPGPLTPSPASQTSPSPSAPSLPPTAVAPPPPSVSSATLSQALPATVAAAVSTPPALIASTQLDQQAVKENGTSTSNHKMDVFIPSSRDGNPVRLDRYSPVKDAANTPNDLFNQKLDGFHSIKDAAYNSMKEAYKEAYSPRKDNNYSPRHDAFNSRKETYSPHKEAGFPTAIKEGFPARKDTTPDNLTNKLIFPPVMDMGDASLKTAASILKEMLKNEEALKVAMSKTEIENAKTSSVEPPVTSVAQQPILNEHRDSSENNNDSKSAGCNRCTENSTTSTSKLGLSSIAMTRTPDKISPPSLSRTPDKCNIPPSRTPDRVTTPVKMMPDRLTPSQQAKPSPDKFMPYLNAHTLYPQLTKLERERDLQRERDAMAQSLAHRAAAAAATINDHKSVSPKMAAVKQGPLPPPPQPKDSIKPKTHSPHTSHADSRDLSRDLSHSKIYAPVTWPPVTVDSRKDEKSSVRGALSDAHKTHLTSSASSSSTVTSSGLSAVTSAGLPIMSTSASVMAAAAAASTSAAATAGQMHGKMDPTASYLEYLRAMSSAYPHLLSQPGMEGSEYLAYIRRYYEWYEYHKLYPYLVPPSPCGRMPPPGVDPRSSLAAADFSKQAGMCLTSPYSPYLYGMDPRMLATAAGASAFDVNKYMNSAARGKDATTTSSETSNGHVSPRTNERKRNTPEVEDEALDLTVKKQRISDPETKSKASENGLRKDTPLVSVDTSRLLPGTLPGTHPLGGMGLYPQFWDFSSLPPGSMPSMGIPGLPHASAAGMFSLPKDQNGALRMQLFPHLAPSCAGSAERDRMLSHLRL